MSPMRDLFDFAIIDFGDMILDFVFTKYTIDRKSNQIGIISSGNHYCVLNKRKINMNNDNYIMMSYHA